MSKINKSALKRVSNANLRAEKVKNYVVGSVITLAAFLLTVVMTFGYNSFSSMKNESDIQAMFLDISNEEVTLLQNVEDVQRVGLYKEIGWDKQAGPLLSLLYSDEAMMELSHAKIVEGKYPEQADEIAIEKKYLVSAKKNTEIGEQVAISFRNEVSREIVTHEFIISGFLQTTASEDSNRVSYNALVSSAFVNQDPALSTSSYSAVAQLTNADQYSNEEIKAKIKEVAKQANIPVQNLKINEVNIDANNMSGGTTLTILLIILVILLACWLVIYNIFYISITKRIKQFGQLRALGATKKQIKMIVMYEGKELSQRYIPIGILLGCLVSWSLHPSNWIMLPSLLLALLAGLFTWFTVRASLNAPANFASRISPVAAIRQLNVESYTHRERENSPRLTPLFLAKVNLTRSKKKTILTVLSLVLSGILFISFASLLNSVDSVARVKQNFPNNGKFMIEVNKELKSESVTLSDLQTKDQLSTSLTKNIMSIDGVENVIEHQFIEATIKDSTAGDAPVVVGIENISPNNIGYLEEQLAEGNIPDLNSTDSSSILMNSGSSANEFYGIQYHVGDQLSLLISNDHEQVQHDFIIAGDIRDSNLETLFYLPSPALRAIAPFNPAERYEVIVAEGANEEHIQKDLQNLLVKADTLKVVSFAEQVKSNQMAMKTITIVVYSFMIFLALFSLMNLTNTIITTIAARKNELGMMEAIGMRRKQVTVMLGYESGFLSIGSLIIALIAGSVIGFGVSEVIGNIGGLSFIQYKFPWSAVTFYIVAYVVVQMLIIYGVRTSMSKQTLIERLKN
ncbi:ABC transporter permease [Paenibacillus sp. FSL H7-0350]|uniref:ABC transporter permease n=1 Tax=Paenibacillus sp. FSL H7-0350 TaxID=2975345 RepID=UPI0031586B53